MLGGAAPASSLLRRSISAPRLRASATLGSSSPRSADSERSCAARSVVELGFVRLRELALGRRPHRGFGGARRAALLLLLELRELCAMCCSSICRASRRCHSESRAFSNAALRLVELHRRSCARSAALALELMAQLVGGRDRSCSRCSTPAVRAADRRSLVERATRHLPVLARAHHSYALADLEPLLDRGRELVILVRELALRIGELALKPRQLTAQ